MKCIIQCLHHYYICLDALRIICISLLRNNVQSILTFVVIINLYELAMFLFRSWDILGENTRWVRRGVSFQTSLDGALCKK